MARLLDYEDYIIDQKINFSDSETDIENQAEEESDEETFREAQRNNHCSSVALDGFNKGEFVIFAYDGTHFVGLVVSKCEEGLLIKSMLKSLNNWRWPIKEDLNLYRIEDIKEKIQEPRIINQKRSIYSVPEFEKYRDFI